jgi:hypothetical protein
MRILKTVLVAALLGLGMACGYSKPATTPAAAGTMPTISKLSPDSATHGDGEFSLIVSGSNFNGNASVNFNNTSMTTVWTNSGLVTATIPASAIATAGMVQVTVTNPGTPGGEYGGGTQAETSAPMTFTIN